MADRPRWLVFGIGNPSRGDDALGALFAERLDAWVASTDNARSLPMELVVETDFQVQIEHALDLAGVDGAVFVDATLDAEAPFTITRLAPEWDVAHTSHALSPAAVLAVARQLGQELPPCWQLAIPGERFELGEALSERAGGNLAAAFQATVAALTGGGPPLFI